MHLTGVHLTGVHLIGVYLIGAGACNSWACENLSQSAYHCVGWHAVVCYGVPEWFRVVSIKRMRLGGYRAAGVEGDGGLVEINKWIDEMPRLTNEVCERGRRPIAQ